MEFVNQTAIVYRKFRFFLNIAVTYVAAKSS